MLTDKKLNEIYPNIITGMPEAEIAFKGVTGWISQSENRIQIDLL